ncbi:MAG: leucine-rich repeat protein, partial [Lachnospiraceae bacterium]|nr:leucine-rich repeat protein [Lachnospiraceae bacterium]
VTDGPSGGVSICHGKSKFTMCGGMICNNNTADSGGGVFMYPGSAFVMTGGVIKDNKADKNGGGILALGNSVFEMSGGKVTGNHASAYGGIGLNSDKASISGNSVVKDNMAGGTKDPKTGLYTGGTASNVSGVFHVTGKLGDDACVGVNLSSGTGIFAEGDEYTLTDADVMHFESDAAAYVPVLDTENNTAVLKKAVTVSGIKAKDKVYDGSREAALDFSDVNMTGVDDADVISVSANSIFDTASSGTEKTVTISDIRLGGADADKYGLARTGQQTIATAEIYKAGGFCGESAAWIFEDKDGTLTISGNGAMKDYDESAPWTKSSFSEEIKHVTIQEGVTTLGDNSFAGLTNLEDVALPDSIVSIGSNVFDDDEALSQITFAGTKEQWGEIAIDEEAGLPENNFMVDCTDEDIICVSLDQCSADDIPAQVYTGKPIKPELNITFNDYKLKEGEDYTAVYTANINAGTATITVSGNGTGESGKANRVTGTMDVHFTINKKPITITAGSASEKYDGSALTNNTYTYSENGLADGDEFASVTVTGSQTAVGSSNNVPSMAKIVNTAGEDVTENYDITYENGTLTVFPVCEHKLTKTVYSAPSCSMEGNIAYWTCSECHRIFADALATESISMEDTVIEKVAHTPAQAVSENSVPATCTADGSYDSVIKCSVCGEEIERNTIPVQALGHDFGEWVLTKEPTETEDGVYTRTCKRDPGHKETKVAPAKNHEHVFVPVGKKEATCTSDGMEAYYKCSGCDLLFSEAKADAVILDETALIIKGGHKGGTATCCNKAVCEVCHEEYGSLDPANHEGETYTENQRQATCTADGFTGDIYCKSCNGLIKNGEIDPATGHHQAAAVKENVMAATCVSDGSYDEVIRCSDCKEILSSTHKTENAHGHAYGTPSYEWSADGKQCTATATCTNDDCTDETEGHSITESATVTSAVKKDATTTEKGITTYTATFKNSHFSTQTKDITDIPVKQNGSGDSGSGDSGTGGNGTINGNDNGSGGNGTGNSGTGDSGSGNNGTGNGGSGSGNNETPGKQDEQVKVGDVVTDTTTKSEVKITSDKAGNETAEYVGIANKNATNAVIPASVTIGGKTYKITTIRANAFKGSKVKKVTLGKYIKKLSPKAFNGSKVTTIIAKTTKLTKKSVKNCLKGAKAKTITLKVKVGSKAKNKKYRNLYKKYFTAKNAGKKATVK